MGSRDLDVTDFKDLLHNEILLFAQWWTNGLLRGLPEVQERLPYGDWMEAFAKFHRRPVFIEGGDDEPDEDVICPDCNKEAVRDSSGKFVKKKK